MSTPPKLAHFTVCADMEQSARWKQVAEAAGHVAIGTWLAEAADAYTLARVQATISPPPLSWSRGARFSVVLEDGQEVERSGWVSPPFGIFRGEAVAPTTTAYTLAAGLYLGQRKRFRCTVAAATPHGVITPAAATGYTSVELNVVGQTVDLEWIGAGWSLVGTSGVPTVV